MRDRWLICIAAFLRAFGIGMVGLMLALHLGHEGLGYGIEFVGLVVGAGLLGGAAASALAAFVADRGRRRWLVGLALASAAGGVVVAEGRIFASSHWLVVVAAFVGMINGMGRDRGASQVIETAVLPATTDDAHRTKTFAWYTMLQDIGHGLGALAGGLPSLLMMLQARQLDGGLLEGLDRTGALRLCLWLYSGLMLLSAVSYLFLSPAVEVRRTVVAMRLSPESRHTLFKLCSLFLLDALGSGFIVGAMLVVFFVDNFKVSDAEMSVLIFLSRVANAGSHLGAAWLAKRIGLINTMVFTHIPSSLLLVTVGFVGNFWLAAFLFLLRESLLEMDVPTRSSYVMAVVRPEERTFVSAVTSLVRMGGWAVGPYVAGLVMTGTGLAAPLVACATLKITYDVLLWRSFRHLKPPEERKPG